MTLRCTGTFGFGSPSSVTVKLSGCGWPTVAVWATAIDMSGGLFGSLSPGQSASRTFRLINGGGRAIKLDLSSPIPFELAEWPATLPAGESSLRWREFVLPL